MALRLTGIPTPDGAGTPGEPSTRPSGGGLKLAAASKATPTAQSGRAFGAQLREDARLQLAINQLDRYKALFDRAAEHEDGQARYHAHTAEYEDDPSHHSSLVVASCTSRHGSAPAHHGTTVRVVETMSVVPAGT